MLSTYPRGELEYVRWLARQKFQNVRSTWIEAGKWALPHRTKWLLSEIQGQRNNQHIVDSTHVIALRSCVAGFLEGNTSASRPWYRIGHPDDSVNRSPENRQWLDTFTRRTLANLARSNFYDAAAGFYYDFNVFNTASYYIDERQNPKQLYFHVLAPGSYYCINNAHGIADILVREFQLTVKALVDQYGKKDKSGKWDWSNFSPSVKKMYEDVNYTQLINVVHIIQQNKNFDPSKPVGGDNRQWMDISYEVGGSTTYAQDDLQSSSTYDPKATERYLKISFSKRKPFIVGRSHTSSNFEYGEKGPTTDALGLIKSLNKKAIGKDIALDQMLKPALQGPAAIKKSYITTAPSSFVPLDINSATAGGLKPIFQINPAIGALVQDVGDMRTQVDKLYYSEYLMYLTQNPKTRTATETDAVVDEQRMVIGPNLQSLDFTHNNPLVYFMMDYTLDEDPYLPPPPQSLQGQTLMTEFISVFAQAQRAADLPAIDRYVQMVTNVGQFDKRIFDKLNTDKLADLYEDRLFLPAGLNNAQARVDAIRQQQMQQAQQQQALQQTLPAVAGAVKDMGLGVQK